MPTPHLPDLDTLTAVLTLESIDQFGPQKFRDLHDGGVSAIEVVAEPDRLPIGGKRGDQFRSALRSLDPEQKAKIRERARQQLERADRAGAHILIHGDPLYPDSVWRSNNPVPVLYILGNPEVAASRGVACVGSREIRPPYADRQREFAAFAAVSGWTVVSGFALGADSIAHRAAYDAGGKTVCVMPCGLDRPFPPENRGFWDELRAYPGAVMASEFGFGTGASSLTLRKRNKLIVAFARGVLIGQSATNGGAMNAYRFAVEQRKPTATFASDGTAATTGNHLIGAGSPAGKRQPGAPPGTVFPAEERDVVSWERWLAEQSSSI